VQILSQTLIVMVGEAPTTYPFPPALQGTQLQGAYLAVQNLGAADAMIQIGQNSYLAPGTDGAQLVAAPVSGVAPGTLHDFSGPLGIVPITAGGPNMFTAVAIPSQVIAAITSATASNGSNQLTVTSAANIAVGQCVSDGDVAIQPATTVVSIAGLNVTLSLPTVAAMNGTSVQFSAPANPQPPGLIAVALGI
jgi:hypothetical protein